MTKITENDIELMAIEELELLGYTYIHGPEMAPDGPNPERQGYGDTILLHRLLGAINKLNPNLPADTITEAIRQLQGVVSPDLIANNEKFHRLITEGIPVSVTVDGAERGERVRVIDFTNPQNNDFLAVNQFTVIENGNNKRPDLLVFVNGIPVVVFELKNATDENATITSAFKQIQTYKSAIPTLFTPNAFIVISDGLEAKAGTLSAGQSRFMTWKSEDGKKDAASSQSGLVTLIRGMMHKHTLLDLIRYFIVFEKSRREDPATGIVVVQAVKKMAAYHQYYAVNKAVESTMRASGYMAIGPNGQLALSNGTNTTGFGDRKGGVVWHTQGSGKSLSMVFYAGKIVLRLDNPTIVVITDRNDLDDQLFDTFAASKQLLRQEPQQASDREDLKRLLKVASGGIVFTTIQKFQPEEGNVYEELSDRKNIIVIADEAHRTQYGFQAKVVDARDESGALAGKTIKYGFAKYMRDALPNATYLGFTGTPIENTDVNTPAVFGNYIDIYDIAQAVEDGATVPIYYESRLVKVALSDEGKQLVEELDDELDQEELTTTQKAKAKWTQLEALIGSESRLDRIADDIIKHFEARQMVFEGKAMIVCMSRRIAAKLYDKIISNKPEWHHDDLDKGIIKVVMTSASSDGPEISKHHTTKEQRSKLADRMKNSDDELKLVIVRDMWLTGFDAPSMHTLYIDKPMKGHNLMQAIARVNRVYKDKPGGLVVDYLGIASDLKKALSFYSDSGGRGDPTLLQEGAVELMEEKLEVIRQMYHGFDYSNYFHGSTQQKLSTILSAEEHVLGLDDGKKRYINEVTALSKAFAIAIPHERALEIKDEVSYFQAVKARLAKFETTGPGLTDEQLETTIRQVVDQALVSDKVVDVFDAAGIKKPDISILSEEFLLELKGMEHKRVAIEVLRKILSDEIKSRRKTNVVQSRSLMEMLESAIKKYQNKILTAAEVIEELINMGKQIVSMDEESKKMGLTTFEYAFYTAVADNDSAKELMGKDKLRELAVVLTKTIKQNATIDWSIRETVRARLRVSVKRLLRKYGYPPDMQLLATETVLKQAEEMAEELAA
jgi:type I restriction enzyme, R subunit